MPIPTMCLVNREKLKVLLAAVMRASPLDPNLNSKLMPVAAIRKAVDLNAWAIGSDSDIGGLSQAKLEVFPDGHADAGKGRFYGSLSSKVQSGMRLGGSNVDRSGYAGMRTKVGALSAPKSPIRSEKMCLGTSDSLRAPELGHLAFHISESTREAVLRRGDALLCEYPNGWTRCASNDMLI